MAGQGVVRVDFFVDWYGMWGTKKGLITDVLNLVQARM